MVAPNRLAASPRVLALPPLSLHEKPDGSGGATGRFANIDSVLKTPAVCSRRGKPDLFDGRQRAAVWAEVWQSSHCAALASAGDSGPFSLSGPPIRRRPFALSALW